MKYKPAIGNRGYVLPVILVLLVILASVGVAISKMTIADQKFSGGISDYKRAFASAEAALAAGEAFIGASDNPFSPFNSSAFDSHTPQLPGLFNGYKPIDDAIQEQHVFTLNSVKPPITSGTIEGVYAQPVFIIELLSSSCQSTSPRAIFKVTSKGWGASQSTTVTLQSTVRLRLNCGGNNSGGDSGTTI